RSRAPPRTTKWIGSLTGTASGSPTAAADYYPAKQSIAPSSTLRRNVCDWAVNQRLNTFLERPSPMSSSLEEGPVSTRIWGEVDDDGHVLAAERCMSPDMLADIEELNIVEPARLIEQKLL